MFDPFLDSAGKELMLSVSLGSSSLGGLIHRVDVSGFVLWPNSLRGRRLKGKGKRIRARDHAPATEASGQRTCADVRWPSISKG